MIRRMLQQEEKDMSVIYDPLGQSYGPASSNHYFQLKVVFLMRDLVGTGVRTDVQTPRVKIVMLPAAIVACGTASYISGLFKALFMPVGKKIEQ